MKPLFLIVLSFFLLSFNGDKVRKYLERSNIKGKVKSVTEFEYGPPKSSKKKKGKLYDKTVTICNNQGKWIELYLYDSNNNIEQKNFRTYRIKDKQIEEKSYNKNDSLKFREVYQYDSTWSYCLMEQSYSDVVDSSNSFDTKIEYKFDDIANTIEEYDYEPNGIDTNSKYVKKFDDKGNMMEGDDYLNNVHKLSHKTIYKFDDNGNNIEVSGYESNGRLSSRYNCKYENFDNEGNWLKQIRLHNNEVELITERIIEYYK